jgi:hypothetical protein
MVRIGEDGAWAVEQRALEPRTYIHDRTAGKAIMMIEGVVVLPVGADIELTNPNVTAKVVGVRLLTGNETTPVSVCLDVDVPAEWWAATTR